MDDKYGQINDLVIKTNNKNNIYNWLRDHKLPIGLYIEPNTDKYKYWSSPELSEKK